MSIGVIRVILFYLVCIFVVISVLECMLQRIVIIVDAGRVTRILHIFKSISQLQIVLQ